MFLQIILVIIAIIVILTIVHSLRGGNFNLITKNLTCVYNGLRETEPNLTKEELLFCTACLNGNVYVRKNPEIVSKFRSIASHCCTIPYEEAMFVEFVKLVMIEYFLIDNLIPHDEKEINETSSIVISNHNKITNYYKKALISKKQLNYPKEMVNGFRELYSQYKGN